MKLMEKVKMIQLLLGFLKIVFVIYLGKTVLKSRLFTESADSGWNQTTPPCRDAVSPLEPQKPHVIMADGIARILAKSTFDPEACELSSTASSSLEVITNSFWHAFGFAKAMERMLTR